MFSVAVCSVMKVELLQLCSVRYRLGEQPFEPLVHFSEGSLSLGGGCDGGGWGKAPLKTWLCWDPLYWGTRPMWLSSLSHVSSSCLISRLQICFQHFWCWLLVKISDAPVLSLLFFDDYVTFKAKNVFAHKHTFSSSYLNPRGHKAVEKWMFSFLVFGLFLHKDVEKLPGAQNVPVKINQSLLVMWQYESMSLPWVNSTLTGQRGESNLGPLSVQMIS